MKLIILTSTFGKNITHLNWKRMYDSCSDNCFAGICPSLQYVGFGFGTFSGNETVADLGFNVDADATSSWIYMFKHIQYVCVYMFIYPEDPYVQVYFPTFGGFHCKCIGKSYGILGKNYSLLKLPPHFFASWFLYERLFVSPSPSPQSKGPTPPMPWG